MMALSPEPRPLGKSDLMVSPLAWGMWRFAGSDVTAAQARCEAALAAGITLFDTAERSDGSGIGPAASSSVIGFCSEASGASTQ